MTRRVEFPPEFQADWTTTQMLFIEWMALPNEERPDDVRTQRAFAKAHGVHENTLVSWKKIPGFTDAVYDLGLAYLGGEVGQFLAALARKAKKEDVPAIRTALEVLQKYRPSSAVAIVPVIVYGADRMKDISEEVARYEKERLADARRGTEGA